MVFKKTGDMHLGSLDKQLISGGSIYCRGEYLGQRRWKENTVNLVSSEEVRDESSEVEGKEGGKNTVN